MLLKPANTPPPGPALKEHFFSFGDCCIAVTENLPHDPDYSLFFLHGRLEGAAAWLPLFEHLGERVHCVAVDFPGFGKSFSARETGLSFLELVELVNQVVARFAQPGCQPILVAHDTGGAIAQVCAVSNNPDLIRGLILINCATVHDWIAPLSWMDKKLFFRRISTLIKSIAHRAPEPCLAMHAAWRDRASCESSLSAINTLARSWPGHYERLHWKRELQKLGAPALVLWGGEDPIHPVERGWDLLNEVQDAAFFVDNTSGHWPALENPDWVATRIREFLFHQSQQIEPHLNWPEQDPIAG